MSWSWFGYGSGEERDNRKFEVVIYEEDYKELCAWVLRKPHIETGGDLFGLWADEYNAVIQFALGPGKKCRRTTASFYQDVDYLAEVGSYLTENEGVCHIGEWHSHHQLGLARPSGGDKNTVWNNMPTYNLKRFVIFIANIEASQQEYNVNIGCFLFEIDSNGHQRPVIPGKFKILYGENPFSRKKELNGRRINGEEEKSGDEFDIDIKNLLLKEEKGRNSPSVTMRRPETKKRNQREDKKRNQPPPKRNRGQPPPNDTTKPQVKQCDQEYSDTTVKREGSEDKPGAPTAGQKKENAEDREEEDREEYESKEEDQNVEVRKDKNEGVEQPQEKTKEEGMETDDPENQRNDIETENEDNSKRDDDLKKLEASSSAGETMLTVNGDDKQGTDEMAGSATGKTETEDESKTTAIQNVSDNQGPAEFDAEKTEKEDQTKTKPIDEQGSAESAKLVAGKTNTENQSKTKEIDHKQSPAVSVAEKTKKEDQMKSKEIGDKQRQAKSADSATEKAKIEEAARKITGKGSAKSVGPTVSAASGKTKREVQTKKTDKKPAPQNGKGGSKRPGGARKTK